VTKDINHFLGDTSTSSNSVNETKYSGTLMVVAAVAGGVLGFFIGSAVGSAAGIYVGDSKATERERKRSTPPSNMASSSKERAVASTESHPAPLRRPTETERFPVTERQTTTFGTMFSPSSKKTLVSAT